jgi:septal ring factor EnvC (AmiA/AmiB activator)
MRERTRKVILRLKEVREQKRLTYQEIVDICENNNESVSLSSVKRLFAKGSEEGSDYRRYTLEAIFHAVIGTDDIELTAAEEAAMTDAEKEVFAENSALKAMLEMERARIESMQQQINELKREKENLEQTISTIQIKLDTTNDIIRLAMESFGRGSS